MTFIRTCEVDERTEQLESQLAALDAAIEKLKQERGLEFSILEVLPVLDDTWNCTDSKSNSVVCFTAFSLCS